MTKFSAALDDPYAVFSTFSVSIPEILPAPEEMVTNFGGPFIEFRSKGCVAWNNNRGATTLMLKCSVIAEGGVVRAGPK